ncbi:hypothetical protein POTOM_028737 [Populus tomentosa]|uniref:Serine-threonine/tyrosine-protein kinase catalytic domain-containing protein n=1 Tax=Populus tomentosa TaxID=118781 RepID=A0A8X7ZEF6_POPTO|nr:hypothetical protein POTOM_028737 [Populus tomentosa]
MASKTVQVLPSRKFAMTANAVATKLIQRCPNQKVAFVFNESCLLQYSDLPFFSTADIAIRLVFLSPQNAEDPVLFRSQLGSLLGNISSNAAADTSRLADGRTSYTSSIDIYEYAKKGHFSTKSDVYSFGILVLEIVKGQKISSFRNSINLKSRAWRHWTNGTALELADPTLDVMMLNGNTMTSPTPSRPGSYMPRGNSGSASGTEDSGSTLLPVSSQQSINWVSITELYPR